MPGGGMPGPVSFPFTFAVPVGGTFLPLNTWQYETPDVPCMVQLLERATAVGLLSFMTSGGDTIKQEGNVQAGGTAGTTPSDLNTRPITGKANPNKKLLLQYRNPTGGIITIDGVIELVPLRAAAAGGGGARRRPARRRR